MNVPCRGSTKQRSICSRHVFDVNKASVRPKMLQYCFPRLLMRSLRNRYNVLATQRACDFSSAANSSIERLTNRSLVRVSGKDAVEYLQGLITNDIRHLSEDHAPTKDSRQSSKAMYCMFLDARGRVILDSIVYRVVTADGCDKNNGVYFVECDSEMSSTLVKHLKLYKLRKKVDISPVSDEMEVWVEFNPNTVKAEKKKSYFLEECPKQSVFAVRDPRLNALGVRVLCSKGELNDIVSNLKRLESGHYRFHRYRLGVGEGILDIPPGNSFPLEANCDYLHGVSFHKGCYVGQELTARTHHTGVVRKRLMPLYLSSSVSQVSETSIVDPSTGKSVGKFRGVVNLGDDGAGLGLLRVAEALRIPLMKAGDSELKTEKPFWWPEEAPKELKAKGGA
ncbi:putative transferase CAF17 homolog, mitochondrial [Ischnura elegans]|uniref:putative transferase CAF17 homolog, mitochondrial n=1 Tax=Ischnura elegans TaxID=197161 RepID=UPI001ED8ABA0|nr:putative transferase CAF17 homolog, mitochondrial [Ischnura elegans]